MNNIITFSTNTLSLRLSSILIDDYQTQCMTLITLSSLVTMVYFLCSGLFSTLYYTMLIFSTCCYNNEGEEGYDSEDEEYEDGEEENEDEETNEHSEESLYVKTSQSSEFSQMGNKQDIPEGFICEECDKFTCPNCGSTQLIEDNEVHNFHFSDVEHEALLRFILNHQGHH